MCSKCFFEWSEQVILVKISRIGCTLSGNRMISSMFACDINGGQRLASPNVGPVIGPVHCFSRSQDARKSVHFARVTRRLKINKSQDMISEVSERWMTTI